MPSGGRVPLWNVTREGCTGCGVSFADRNLVGQELLLGQAPGGFHGVTEGGLRNKAFDLGWRMAR